MTIEFLLNKGIVTYIDRTDGGNFAVSFRGDTVSQLEALNVYMVDSTMIQITRFRIPEQSIPQKYYPVEERKLLLHFYDYEFGYMQDTVFGRKLDGRKEFFSNENSKQFLLWYFQVPNDLKDGSLPTAEADSSTLVATWTVDYQLFLSFVTDDYVTMVNMPVFENEDRLKKIDYLKSYVANSVRVYDGLMSVKALDNQIKHYLKNDRFEIRDSIRRFTMTIPYWLNILEQDKYPLLGVFPDIDNISNALLQNFVRKSAYNSFAAFRDQVLKSKSVKKVRRLTSSTERIERYTLTFVASTGYEFTCQYVFLNMSDHYGILNFTATDETYHRNVGRFNEFVEGIRLY